MSRSILISAIYKNNKRNNRGLYDGKNSDMSTSPFTCDDMRKIIDDTEKDIKGKTIKEFKVNIYTSNSYGYGSNKTLPYNSISDMKKDVGIWTTIIK